jgi:hypothetical protein
MRRIVEEPDILPGSHSSLRWPRVTSSVDNAVLLFSLRTLLRSRQHRVVLSLYLGTGFAVMLVLLRPAVGKEGTVVAWLAVSILMLCVAAVAMRIVFSMPIALRANWLFRVAALHPVATYSKAMRRTLLLLAVVPVWLGFAALFFFLMPWRIVAAHLVALGLLGSILADTCAYGFHKIPFTCSYQPGRVNIQFAFWAFLVLLPFTRMASTHEWKLLQHANGQALIALGLSVLALSARWRTIRSAQAAETMQFEEVDEAEILSLELSNDGALLQKSL